MAEWNQHRVIAEPYCRLERKRKLGEQGSDLQFPRARAPEYSAERGQAYLLSSEWVQESPCRSGRHARIQSPDSDRWLSSTVRIGGYFGYDKPCPVIALRYQISPEFSGALRSC